MSKVASVILVLVLFFGTVINGFAADWGGAISDAATRRKGSNSTEVSMSTFTPILIGIGVGAIVVIVLSSVLRSRSRSSRAEAPAPDDGISMVSTEDETPNAKTDDKTILNVLQHVEAGATPNKDLYVGLCFQY
ncbi:MAG: hypothetical protein LBB89_01485 [Treponema sp.]|nr:hypothetical protein [Treponema sp.]